jgi:hypothetical protein
VNLHITDFHQIPTSEKEAPHQQPNQTNHGGKAIVFCAQWVLTLGVYLGLSLPSIPLFGMFDQCKHIKLCKAW